MILHCLAGKKQQIVRIITKIKILQKTKTFQFGIDTWDVSTSVKTLIKDIKKPSKKSISDGDPLLFSLNRVLIQNR